MVGITMIREASKAIARQIPPIDALIRQRDALLDRVDKAEAASEAFIRHRDALLVELEETRNQLQTAKAVTGALTRHRDALLGEIGITKRELVELTTALKKPRFITAYAAHVRRLMALYPIDEAMSLAVGGSYDEVGRDEVTILQRLGVIDGMSVIDLGCGSGRLAKHLGLTFDRLEYLGIDVVPELLEYAAANSPPCFRFVINEELGVPAPDNSTDFVVAFSVFTHLLHEETYLYLEDAKRVLRPGGSIVFSFLESRRSWQVFEEMVKHRRAANTGHLNMFTERPQIEAWATHLGMHLVGFDLGPPHDGFGQCVTAFTKPG
jgi:SAM-dependent methyltransferase